MPGKQLLDAVDGMVGDALEDFAQVGFGVEAVELGGSYERVEGGGAFAARVGACEEIVAAAHGDGTEGAFGSGVVDLDAAIVAV